MSAEENMAIVRRVVDASTKAIWISWTRCAVSTLYTTTRLGQIWTDKASRRPRP